jgi:hypothetical protein
LEEDTALKAALRWLQDFKVSTQWTQATSYALKHILERETGVYIENGRFIVAALLRGFDMKFSAGDSSAVFKMFRPAVR